MEPNQQLPNQIANPLSIRRRYDRCELYCVYEKLLENSYKKNEIIVFFERGKPVDKKDIEVVRQSFRYSGIDPNTIKVKRCNGCDDIPVVLFQASNIHTVINGEGVKAGAGPRSTTVGETYSLNFFNTLPLDKDNQFGQSPNKPDDFYEHKEKIIVAVLDTGFDSKLVDDRYLWKNTTDSNCYKEAKTGWNFINDTPDFHDDHPNKHGSIISQYIINEFRKSNNFQSAPHNSVQIMPLKTHDSSGNGDLFGIMCAIYFAIKKGANIINASWGFYYYYEEPFPQLKELITKELRNKGILFIAAAGNKFDLEDPVARQIYFLETGQLLSDDQLRDIALHNFYPAHLSNDENSIITATTTNGRIVSPTQNYSNRFADLGILADKGLKFKLPFQGSPSGALIGGSSFAAAITSGIIGAYCKKSLYKAGINKADFFEALSAIGGSSGIPEILFHAPVLQKRHIKKGAFAKRTG